MNLAAVDLNLLTALDALLREGHVGRAAARVGLSQPAMSHALARLRDALGDPLLVRVGVRMELTPRAESLRAPLAAALESVRGLFMTDAFDPATSERRFKLMMPDIVLDLIFAPLAQRVGAAAPGVRLDVVPWRRTAPPSPEFVRDTDIVISCLGEAYPGFHRQLLYKDSDALAVRRGHPVGARLKRRDVFLAARHVAVVSRDSREDMIDEWLREHGVERRIAVAVPGYLDALHVAARTDLVAFVPRRLIAALAAALELDVVTPPIDPGTDEQFLFYPTRAQVDPGSVWLRRHILAIGRALQSAKR